MYCGPQKLCRTGFSIHQILRFCGNIQTIDLFGENGVEGVTLARKKGTPEEEIVKVKIDGFFLAIGHNPNSDIFRKFLETDQVGYIKTIPGTSKTNIPGVFAAGDVQDPSTVRLLLRQDRDALLQWMQNGICQS